MRDFVSEKSWGRLLATLVPSLPAMAVALVLIYDLLLNDAMGILAVASTLFPGLDVLMDEGREVWQAEGYAEVMALGWILLAILVALIYYTVWSWLFPRYFIRYGQHRVLDGRLYWSTTNGLTALWDRLWGSPPRQVNDHYVLQCFPLNPIAPGKSLTRVSTTKSEPIQRTLMDVVVAEHRGRHLIAERHLITTTEVIPHISPDNDYVEDIFDARAVELVKSCSDLSFGNPHIRHGVMTDASYYEDERIFHTYPTPEDEMDDTMMPEDEEVEDDER